MGTVALTHPNTRAGVLAGEFAGKVEFGQGLRRLDVRCLGDHQSKLYKAAYSWCGSREDAEDLVQITFERVLRRPRFLKRETDIAYLMRVLRNSWIKAYKARTQGPQTVEWNEAAESVLSGAPDPTTSAAELRVIDEMVSELTMPLREALVAVDIIGLSYRQAALALSIPEGTVMSRLHRARKQLAQQLDQAGLELLR